MMKDESRIVHACVYEQVYATFHIAQYSSLSSLYLVNVYQFQKMLESDIMTAATAEAQEEYFQKPAYCGSLECPRYKVLEQYDVSVKQ